MYVAFADAVALISDTIVGLQNQSMNLNLYCFAVSRSKVKVSGQKSGSDVKAPIPVLE